MLLQNFLSRIVQVFRLVKYRVCKEKPKNQDILLKFMKEDPKYSNLDIGPYTYGNPIIKSWDDNTHLRIGKFCSIAGNVQILLGGEHRKDWVSTYPFNVIFAEAKHFLGHPATKGDIVIGNDVWIGQNAMILSGVTIGNGAIIGASSVVSKDIPAYAVAVGNPINIVRFRFSLEEIYKLEEIAWWNWPIEKILEALPFILKEDIGGFIQHYSSTIKE